MPAERPEAAERRTDPPAASDARERFGPLAVERHAKDDGRALLLYTLLEGEQPAPPPAPRT